VSGVVVVRVGAKTAVGLNARQTGFLLLPINTPGLELDLWHLGSVPSGIPAA